MKRFLYTLLLFATFLSTATAQYFPIDTAQLNKAYRTLLQNPQSRELQLDFFRAFPDNWDDFNSTYKYSDKEGYDLSMYNLAYKHIKALAECCVINDTLYCNKLIALSVGASLDVDAPNYLQTLLHDKIQEKNDVFIHCLSKIEKGHQMQFWQFYWSNIVDGQSQEKEFEVLYNINKRRYPNLMKTMSIAFEHFNNKVLFMENFKNMMKMELK
ncbi:MAG: hypothetical protein IKJ31_07780 [Bacteroidaceae bacterium]|nr:hypothetical protein [Bacteroidaceae bacterium]